MPHTPGPWTIKLQAGTRWVESVGQGATYPNEPIARVEPFNLDDEANARLIAAAPVMLAALRSIADTLQRLRETDGWTAPWDSITGGVWAGPFVHAAEDEARALLRAVEG